MKRKQDSATIAGFTATALLVLLLPLCSCGEDNKAAETEEGGLDLLSLHYAARQLRETGTMNLSSQLRSYYLEQGWSSPYTLEEGTPSITVAVRLEAVLRYRVLKPAERWVSFDIKTEGKHGGPPWQQVDVLAGGELLERFEVSGGEFENHEIHIPPELQTAGDNQIVFRFPVVTENPEFLAKGKRGKVLHDKFPFPGTAAYFRKLKIFIGDEDSGLRESNYDETKVFQLVAGGKRLAQLPTSRLIYGFEIPNGSSLTIAGTVEPNVRTAGEISLSVKSRTDEKRKYSELWSQVFSFEADSEQKRFEANIPLDSIAGTSVELSFDVSSSSIFAEGGVVWQKIRLHYPKNGPQPRPVKTREPIRAGDNIRNVIFIVLDAARPDHFGSYGDERGITPNIDKFALESTVFRNAIASAPYTISSISSLFSGMVPEGHGVRKTTATYPEKIINMIRSFKEKGFYTITLAGTQFMTAKFGLTRDSHEIIYLRDPQDKEIRFTTMDIEEMQRGVTLAAESDKPVFMYAHLLPPHWPYRPPQPFNSLFIQRPRVEHWRSWMMKSLFDNGMATPEHPDVVTHHLRYQNNLNYADYVVRQLLNMLYTAGLHDNSIIIVTSDHGESFGENGYWGHNKPVYDGMIRIPLIVKVPGVAAGEVSQQVGLIDFFPTFAEMFELEVENPRFDGRSIAPLLMGQDMEPADYYYSRGAGEKLIFTLRGERFKYFHNDYYEALFDLSADPGEKNNLIDRYPVLATILRQRALLLIASNNALHTEEGREVKLSEDEIEELRNLGYLQ